MLKRLELVVAFFFSFVRLPAPSFTMMRVFASFALLLSATALPVPPGVTSGLYSDLVSKSDFTLNLQPPTESAADVSDALDAVLKLEEQKNQAAFAQFAAQKQQLIEAEKKARSPPSLFLQYVCCVSARNSFFFQFYPSCDFHLRGDREARRERPPGGLAQLRELHRPPGACSCPRIATSVAGRRAFPSNSELRRSGLRSTGCFGYI